MKVFARAVVLALVVMAAAASSAAADGTQVLTGRITSERPDFVYVPFDVPAGTNRVDVSYTYNRVNGNALDIGLFDADGTGLGNDRGFRGWSGGARTSFFVEAGDATPGYRPGRIEPGRWSVVLGPYTVGPQGIDYRIEVTTRSGPQGPEAEPQPAPAAVPGRGAGWYRGDLHLHTVHSDGRYTPAEIADGARAAGLDYFVSTEHNTDTANSVWGRYVGSDMLAIGGEEVTTRAGHWGAIGLPAATWIDWRYRAEDGLLGRFVDQVHDAGGLAVANHPAAACKACGWGFSYGPMDAIEAWNGSWNAEDEQALETWDAMLREGRRLPAVGASDAHRAPDLIGRPQTVVQASALDRRRVLAGIRTGRAYVAESKSVSLAFTARQGRHRAGIGESLPGRAAKVSLRVRGAAGGRVSFHGDRGVLGGGPVTGDDATLEQRVAGARWVRAEVRRADGTMVAFTNPIWLGR